MSEHEFDCVAIEREQFDVGIAKLDADSLK
jgi:hypothetical protein